MTGRTNKTAPCNAKGKGVGITWLRTHSTYQGNDCLIWPLFRDPRRGYGVVGFNGKIFKAHRLMCEMVNGSPPTPDHETAHSCGRGQDGCCTPKHLSWKTRTENQADRVGHGTAGPRSNGGRRYKLTGVDAAEIRALAGQITVTELAERFRVDRSTIRMVIAGKTWNGKRVPRLFTTAEVEAIKATRGQRTANEVAADYGVHHSVIERIRAGRSYRGPAHNEVRSGESTLI